MDEPLGECKGIQTDGSSMDVIERLLKQEKEKNAVLTEQLNCSKMVEEVKRCHPRVQPPMEEFFMTMVCLRLGLLEQDIAFRFQVSQSTVSRIICTWINFLYLKLKEIPVWPSKEVIQVNIPPELQQMTFSNYKNNNYYKALVGISQQLL